MLSRLVKLVAVMAGTVAVSIGIMIVYAGSSSSREDELTSAIQEVEQRETPRRKAREATEESWEERSDRISREMRERLEKRQAQLESSHAEVETPKRERRKVRRFRWESPAEERGRVWKIPEEESEEAVLTAFLRICIAEADGHLQDCVGIWQVMKNIRMRSCSRDFVRRVTECDENGETMLSVMRRSQRHIMGMIPLRNRRAAWIRNITTDCENPPEGWPKSEALWDARYGSKRCPEVVELGRALIAGDPLPQAPGNRLRWLPGRPITWGGRCESNTASCDDRIACARGLTRVKGGPDTTNAFWRRPLTPDEVEPVCKQLGYGHLVGDAAQPSTEPVEPAKAPTNAPEPPEQVQGG